MIAFYLSRYSFLFQTLGCLIYILLSEYSDNYIGQGLELFEGALVAMSAYLVVVSIIVSAANISSAQIMTHEKTAWLIWILHLIFMSIIMLYFSGLSGAW
jgi:hypothetical protein